MRHPDAKHSFPLFDKMIYWGDCWVVQDIREDYPDTECALEPFSVKKVNIIFVNSVHGIKLQLNNVAHRPFGRWAFFVPILP